MIRRLRCALGLHGIVVRETIRWVFAETPHGPFQERGHTRTYCLDCRRRLL